MQTVIRRLHIAQEKRLLVISDIHAHLDEMRKALCEANFSGDDVLVIVGDLIEKGRNSLGVLRYVMQLTEAGNTCPLMGNVDIWRLSQLMKDDERELRGMVRYSMQAVRWWGGSMLHEMCAELGIEVSEDMDVCHAVQAIRRYFAPELSFIAGLPTILETDRLIFVHGGLPHEDLSAFVGQDPYPLLKCDDFLSNAPAFQKYVIVGHWPVVLYRPDIPNQKPLIDRTRHIVSIDGGCGVKREGQLNLLISQGEDIEHAQCIYCDCLPEVTALEEQPESTLSVSIRWGDHFVERLSESGDMAHIRYHGHEMDVPQSRLFTDENGSLSCHDISNYRLPVHAGDTLKLICRCSEGIYAKKDGVCGWYFGRLK